MKCYAICSSKKNYLTIWLRKISLGLSFFESNFWCEKNRELCSKKRFSVWQRNTVKFLRNRLNRSQITYLNWSERLQISFQSLIRATFISIFQLLFKNFYTLTLRQRFDEEMCFNFYQHNSLSITKFSFKRQRWMKKRSCWAL